MSLNTNKTKELLVYFGREDFDIPRITINGDVIESVLRKATRMPYHVQPVVGGPHHQSRVESKPSAPPTERTEESRPLF